jgi:hypothetical protein
LDLYTHTFSAGTFGRFCSKVISTSGGPITLPVLGCQHVICQCISVSHVLFIMRLSAFKCIMLKTANLDCYVAELKSDEILVIFKSFYIENMPLLTHNRLHAQVVSRDSVC